MNGPPSAWALEPLESVAEVRLGRQRSPKNHTGPQMRPYLRAANVDWDGIKLDDIKHMQFSDDEMDTYRLEPGDLLLNEASGSPDEVGKPGLWQDEVADCAFQNTLLRVRPAPSVDPRYLLHFFRHEALSGRFARSSRGVGIHHLGRKALASWTIPVPPLEEQQRIVTILEAHLSRLDAAETALRTVERRSELAWRAGLLHATHSLGGQSTRLDRVAEVRLGRQRSPKNHTGDFMRPYLRAANVDWDRLRLEDVKSMNFTDAEAAVFELVNGDVLVVEASGSAGEVGKSAVYRGEVPGACFQNTLLRVRSYGSAIPEFLHYYLLADAASGQLLKGARGVGINHIGRARLAAWPVELPDLDAQQRAVSVCSQLGTSVERLRHAVKAARSRAAALRTAVLAAAFSGRLTEAEPHTSEARELSGV